MIRITSTQEGFRRAGHVFGTAGQEYDDNAFDKEQLAMLLDEPKLTVEVIDNETNVDQVVLAIGRLPIDDPDLWMKSGGPQIKALEADLGVKVTAEVRDQAWQIYSEARD
ncbi:MAG TPA: hypothetical protein ENJ30_14140 [Desulfobulbaceae bacterium]|nr:hypothetical protein [Desulfobulbaceae bacterium]